MVMAQFGFSITGFFDEIATLQGCATGALANGACVTDGAVVGQPLNFTQPGLKYNGQWGALDLISLGVALIFGTAGLPHILVRFYTVPTAQAARTSVVTAMVLIGAFYIMTTFLGFGAATLVGKANIGVHTTGDAAVTYIADVRATDAARAEKLQAQLDSEGFVVKAANSNLAAPLLAEKLGGEVFLSFVAAIAFATILAVVAGLTVASSSAFAHDIWFSVVRSGTARSEGEQVLVARLAAVIIGVLAIGLAIGLKTLNVAFLVGLAFAVAASANVPAIVLTLFWRRFNTAGMISGMVTGLASSLVLIVLSPAVMGIDPPTAAVRHLIQAAPIFPLENPGLVSVPLGFLAAVIGSLLTKDERAEAAYSELTVRANTGLGAEV
jgi:cation/acetate symporter